MRSQLTLSATQGTRISGKRGSRTHPATRPLRSCIRRVRRRDAGRDPGCSLLKSAAAKIIDTSIKERFAPFRFIFPTFVSFAVFAGFGSKAMSGTKVNAEAPLVCLDGPLKGQQIEASKIGGFIPDYTSLQLVCPMRVGETGTSISIIANYKKTRRGLRFESSVWAWAHGSHAQSFVIPADKKRRRRK